MFLLILAPLFVFLALEVGWKIFVIKSFDSSINRKLQSIDEVSRNIKKQIEEIKSKYPIFND